MIKRSLFLIMTMMLAAVIIDIAVAYSGVAKYISSLCSLCLYICISYYLFRKDMISFSILCPFLIAQLTLLVSVVALDFSFYAPEVKLWTSIGNAGYVLFMYECAFVFFVILLTGIVSKRVHNWRKRFCYLRSQYLSEVNVISLCLYLLTISLLGYGAVFGYPLLDGQQRFFYWAQVPYGHFISKILFLLSGFGFYVGFVTLALPEGKVSIGWLASLMIVTAILFSNKFSWVCTFFVTFVSGAGFASYITNQQAQFQRNIFKYGAFFSVFAGGLVIFGYMYVHGYTGKDLEYILVNRIFTMQGQVWWFVNESVSQGDFLNNVKPLFVKFSESQQPNGIFLLMKEIMPASGFEFYSYNKIPLSMGFPAILIYTAGYHMAVIYIFLFSLIYLYIFYYLLFSALNLSLLRVLIGLFMLAVWPWALSLGSTYVLFRPIFLIIMLASILDIFFIKKLNFNHA